MREISVDKITDIVRELCIEAATTFLAMWEEALRKGLETEESSFGRYSLEQVLSNVELARNETVAMCQDTGVAVVYVTIGQDVHIVGGSLKDAIDEGVRRGYIDGYLENQ